MNRLAVTYFQYETARRRDEDYQRNLHVAVWCVSWVKIFRNRGKLVLAQRCCREARRWLDRAERVAREEDTR